MRAVWIRKSGGPEVLEVRETPDPEPQKGQVRVRAKACGLNFAEVSARQGIYPDAPKPPCIVGYEGAGVIDKLGDGVKNLKVGDRVMFLARFGAHADTVCVPEHQAVIIPESISFEQAAAMPVNYLTAWHMLFGIRRIQPGDRVLVHMAAGGVGTAVMQLCKSVPDVTTFGTASKSKHDYLREHGCTHPIDYRTQDYVKVVRELTKGEGVDAVLDPLGGKDWSKGYSILRPGGLLVPFGFANAQQPGTRSIWRLLTQFFSIPTFKPLAMMSDNKGVVGVNLGTLWDHQAMIHQGLERLVKLHVDGVAKPHVDGTFPFEKAAEAHGRLELGKNVGKVLLVP
jgi:synaptic vesicle membrane protein VAT-1